MRLSITYMILAHGEPSVIELIDYIKNYWDGGVDRIVVLNDPTTEQFENDLKARVHRVVNHKLEKDYSAHRNLALRFCARTDYTFALDADEAPHFELMKSVKAWLEENGLPHIVCLPRCNVFEGVLPVHCLMYNWTWKDGMIQWPDFQTRLFRNRQGIKWVSPLHESLKGQRHHRVVYMKQTRENSIIHRKIMAKQIEDNTRYATEWPVEDNAGMTTAKLLGLKESSQVRA